MLKRNKLAPSIMMSGGFIEARLLATRFIWLTGLKPYIILLDCFLLKIYTDGLLRLVPISVFQCVS